MTKDGTVLGVPVRYCLKCGIGFSAKRTNQRYCKPEHRPPNFTLRLTAVQAELLKEIASRLQSD